MIVILIFSQAIAMKFENFETKEFESVPEYGVIFRAVHTNFLPTDSFLPIVFKIKFPKLPKLPQTDNISIEKCNRQLNISNKEIFEALLSKRTKNTDKLSKLELNRFEKQLIESRQNNCKIAIDVANNILSKYKAIRNDVHNSYNGLLEILGKKTINLSKTKRNKRAWIDISYLGETVFGFAQAKHVHALQTSVENLLENEYNIANKTEELTDKIAVIANITSRRIDNIWEELEYGARSMNKSFEEINEVIDRLTNDVIQARIEYQNLHDWSVYRFTFQDTLLLLHGDSILLKNKISLWTRSVIRLYSGYLPEEIVTPSELINGLNMLQDNIYKNYPQFQLTHKLQDLNYYYTQRNTKLFVINPNMEKSADSYILYIATKIPVANKETNIVTYQAISLPVPLTTNNTNLKKGFTKIRLFNEFFITTVSKNGWTELSKQDYDYCMSIIDNTCPALHIDKSIHEVSCLSALFFKNYPDIKSYCEVNYFPEAPYPIYIGFVSEGTYILSTRSKIEFICPKYPRESLKLNYGIVKMPCACALSSGELYIPPSLANCNLDPFVILINPIFNAAQFDMEGYDTNSILRKQISSSFSFDDYITPEFDKIAETLYSVL